MKTKVNKRNRRKSLYNKICDPSIRNISNKVLHTVIIHIYIYQYIILDKVIFSFLFSSPSTLCFTYFFRNFCL